MSQENVENLRQIWDAMNRGDTDAWLAFADPHIVYVDNVVPDHIGEEYRGHEGLLKAWTTWLDPWEELRTDIEEVVDGGDQLVSIHRARGRAKATGIEVELRYAYVWSFRGGKVIYVSSYGDPNEALEAAGLSEWGTSRENVEVVQRLVDAWNRRDWDALFLYCHPDLEVTFKAGPHAGTHRGREKVQAVFDDLTAGFDLWIGKPLELFDRGDQVVAIVNNRLRPKGGTSGEFQYRNGHIWTIRDGAVISLVGFPTPREALEAAGLRE